jgi:hypothetical protein
MGTQSTWLVRAALVLALCAGAQAQGTVLVVSVDTPPPAPGVDFAQIHEAVAAAPAGAILLVRAGTYEAVTIDGKSLVIIADGVVDVTDGIVVRNLTADDSVVLRGLSATGASGTAGLEIDGCAGPVWVEACQVTGVFGIAKGEGVRVTTSLATSLVRCELQGGSIAAGGFIQGPYGAAGLRVAGSVVAAWSLTSTGGDGQLSFAENGGSGGAGAFVWENGRLVATGGSYTGGTGAGADEDFDFFCGCFFCSISGSGGAGVQAFGECTVELRDVELVGGEAIPNRLTLKGCVGSDGPPLLAPDQQVILLAGVARTLRLTAPVVEGESLELALFGEPGDAALVLAAPGPTFLSVPYGIVSVPPTLVAVLGALPPSGQLELHFAVPDLGPGIEGLLIVAQPLFLPAGGGKALGSPSATVLLDAAF